MKSTINKDVAMALIRGTWYQVLQINVPQHRVIVHDDEGKEHMFNLDRVTLFQERPIVNLNHLVDSVKKRESQKSRRKP